MYLQESKSYYSHKTKNMIIYSVDGWRFQNETSFSSGILRSSYTWQTEWEANKTLKLWLCSCTYQIWFEFHMFICGSWVLCQSSSLSVHPPPSHSRQTLVCFSFRFRLLLSTSLRSLPPFQFLFTIDLNFNKLLSLSFVHFLWLHLFFCVLDSYTHTHKEK